MTTKYIEAQYNRTGKKKKKKKQDVGPLKTIANLFLRLNLCKKKKSCVTIKYIGNVNIVNTVCRGIKDVKIEHSNL